MIKIFLSLWNSLQLCYLLFGVLTGEFVVRLWLCSNLPMAHFTYPKALSKIGIRGGLKRKYKKLNVRYYGGEKMEAKNEKPMGNKFRECRKKQRFF